jgi:centromere-localized protein 2
MASQEQKLLSNFLVAPASLRDFITLRQFTDIFPTAHRSNPAVEELYRELFALRKRDMDMVLQDIAEEVKKSKQLKREYVKERRRMDDGSIPGLDMPALSTEDEVCVMNGTPCDASSLLTAIQALRPQAEKATYLEFRPREHPRSMRKPRITNL